jgi:hypothetical protein
MPNIKKDELKRLLKHFFGLGCYHAHGFNHEIDLLIQENEAFEQCYEEWNSKSNKNKGGSTID